MKLYNTLTRTKEEFIPLEEGKEPRLPPSIKVSGKLYIEVRYFQ